MFSKSIRTLYLYIVSFLSLMAIVYGTVALVERITNYFYPVSYYSSYYNYNSYEDKYTIPNDYDAIMQRENEKRNEQIQTIKDIFTNLAIVLVATFIYSYHWKMIQKESNMEVV
jgi:hypothetical protein